MNILANPWSYLCINNAPQQLNETPHIPPENEPAVQVDLASSAWPHRTSDHHMGNPDLATADCRIQLTSKNLKHKLYFFSTLFLELADFTKAEEIAYNFIRTKGISPKRVELHDS